MSSKTLVFRGAVAKAILRQGGSEIERECEDIVKSEGFVQRVAITGSGSLPCKKIIHLNTQNDRTWSEKFIDILEMAKSNGLQSLALPVIGTGQHLKIPLEYMAPVMFESVREFSESGPGSVEHVSVVAYDTDTTEHFIRLMDGLYTGATDGKDIQQENSHAEDIITQRT